MQQTGPQESSSSRDAVADRARRLVAPVSLTLHKLHITPNELTISGAALHLVAAWLIIADHSVIAGFVFVVGSLFDMLDGSLARLSAKVTPFGAFLDSTLDRASEGVILAAVTYQFAVQGHPVDAALVVLALLGSLLVSYTRARAEALGVSAKLGIMSRPERVVLIAIGLFFNVMPYAIYLLVVLTTFTVVQRVIFTYRALKRV